MRRCEYFFQRKVRVQAAVAVLWADLVVQSAAWVRRPSGLCRQAPSRLRLHLVTAGAGPVDHLEHPRSHRVDISIQTDPSRPIFGLGHFVLSPIASHWRPLSQDVTQSLPGGIFVWFKLFLYYLDFWNQVSRWVGSLSACLPGCHSCLWVWMCG